MQEIMKYTPPPPPWLKESYTPCIYSSRCSGVVFKLYIRMECVCVCMETCARDRELYPNHDLDPKISLYYVDIVVVA